MADYKELLRRAISALPENNGAARRAVYEKARSALVGQLRAINPPLPARDITQHRLQLEDCIRQVEQEASEAVITLGRDQPPIRFTQPQPPSPPPAPVERPRVVEPPKPVVAEAPPPPAVVEEVAKPSEPDAPPPQAPEPAQSAEVVSIEDIIAQAAATSGAAVTEVANEPSKPEPARVVPVVAPRSPSQGGSAARELETATKAPTFEPRRDLAAVARAEPAVMAPPRLEPAAGGALARQPQVAPVETALSSVREVELETKQPDTREAEGAIASAIETLDREARGEATAPLPDKSTKAADLGGFGVAPEKAATDDGFVVPAAPAKSGAGLTIFLVVFAVLLAGAGGAGFWAWREGYVDLDQMFGRAPQTEVATTPAETITPTLDPVQSTEVPTASETPEGPGNTATATPAEPTTSLEGVEIEDRLEPTPEAVVPTGTETALPDIGTGEDKGEERLPGSEETAVAAVDDPVASVDPSVLAGSQSLLLEASADGQSGAVPFSGTVEWSEGTDELGLPTLIGRASIPARSLGVDVTIRKNSDPSLPASHLMEVDFDVNDSFIGGTISSLPGVLLKDQELVPGTPLVGASARVVGNSFLFALSASEADAATNTGLLEDRRWMDLAVVYGTGRNAILTLEKDDEAQALFQKVFTAWAD